MSSNLERAGLAIVFFIYSDALTWGWGLLTPEGVRASQFLQIVSNLPGSTLFTCKPTDPEPVLPTTTSVGSYTQSPKSPALVTPGQVPANPRQASCWEPTEIIQTNQF